MKGGSTTVRVQLPSYKNKTNAISNQLSGTRLQTKTIQSKVTKNYEKFNSLVDDTPKVHLYLHEPMYP